MTDELTKTFFDTFGIEPKCVKRTLKLAMPAYNENDLPKDLRQFISSQARVYRVYPQITDRILLELICILTKFYGELVLEQSTGINDLKEQVLNIFIRTSYKDNFKHRVRTLFKEGNNEFY